MTKVVYMDGSQGDSRVLAAADLSKAGVEGFTKTTFIHGEAKDIDDAVAQALVNDPELFGLFATVAVATELTLFDVPEVKAKASTK